jgi:hypothetical protein
MTPDLDRFTQFARAAVKDSGWEPDGRKAQVRFYEGPGVKPGATHRCGLARSRNPAGVMPACVAASHGRSIQPCSCHGNGAVDA